MVESLQRLTGYLGRSPDTATDEDLRRYQLHCDDRGVSPITLKHRTAWSVAYGAGLRVSEVGAFKVGDIDSRRMLPRIEKGNGQKDRYALLPPIMRDRLRTWL